MAFSHEFRNSKKTRDGQTNGPTNRWMDRPSKWLVPRNSLERVLPVLFLFGGFVVNKSISNDSNPIHSDSLPSDLKVQQHLVNLRHKHQHDKKASQSGKQSSFPVIRSLSEIGKKASGVSSNGEEENNKKKKKKKKKKTKKKKKKKKKMMKKK